MYFCYKKLNSFFSDFHFFGQTYKFTWTVKQGISLIYF